MQTITKELLGLKNQKSQDLFKSCRAMQFKSSLIPKSKNSIIEDIDINVDSSVSSKTTSKSPRTTSRSPGTFPNPWALWPVQLEYKDPIGGKS